MKDRDNLQDAARCLVNSERYMITKPKPTTLYVPYVPSGPNGWMGM